MTDLVREQIEGFPVIDAAELGQGQEGTVVVRGLTAALRPQIVEKTKQPHISGEGAYTIGDLERFPTVEAVEEREKSGLYYMLVQDLEAGGLIWLSPKKPAEPGYAALLTDANYTFAIRLYEGFIRRGLARPFMSTVLKDFKERHDRERKVWLSVDRGNEDATRLYQRTGWERRIIDDEREFMIKCLKRGTRR